MKGKPKAGSARAREKGAPALSCSIYKGTKRRPQSPGSAKPHCTQATFHRLCKATLQTGHTAQAARRCQRACAHAQASLLLCIPSGPAVCSRIVRLHTSRPPVCHLLWSAVQGHTRMHTHTHIHTQGCTRTHTYTHKTAHPPKLTRLLAMPCATRLHALAHAAPAGRFHCRLSCPTATG